MTKNEAFDHWRDRALSELKAAEILLSDQKNALILAQLFREALEKANIPFESVILFGSHARGEGDEKSDIDLAVIGPAFLKSRTQEMIAVRKLRRPISYKLSPLWFRKEYLENPYSTLAGEILKEGVVV